MFVAAYLLLGARGIEWEPIHSGREVRAYIAKKSLKDSSSDTTGEKTKKRFKTVKKTIIKIISKVVMSLSLYEFIGALDVFNGKVLLLAVAVCAATGLIKLLIPDKWRKFVTILPFVLGIVACAAYDFFVEKANAIAPATISTGIQIGVAATIYYIVYDQFFKGGAGDKTVLLTGLLTSVIKKEDINGTIKKVLACLSAGGEELPSKLFSLLQEVKTESATVEEIMLTVKNILGSGKT